jgi:hypothetical protein
LGDVVNNINDSLEKSVSHKLRLGDVVNNINDSLERESMWEKNNLVSSE